MIKIFKIVIILFSFLSILFWERETSSRNMSETMSSLRLMTYNIYGYEMLHRKRTAALINLIQDSGAHIIALQEAKPWFLRRLLKNPLIKFTYKHTNLEKGHVAKGGLFILSSYPIKENSYIRQPGKRNKYMLIAKILIDDEIVPVVNVHLESPLRSNRIRKKQLQKVFRKIQWYRNSIVMGDFNFGDSEIEASAISRRFQDLWLSLKNDKSGYTWDMERNVLAQSNAYKRETSRRLDRILVNHRTWEPVNVNIIGKSPIYVKRGILYPSDHYAVIGTVKRM